MEQADHGLKAMESQVSHPEVLEPMPARVKANLPADLSVPSGIGVLEKAMSLLNIVSGAPSPLTFTELLRAGHLPKATLHRILATLMREGLLRFDAGTRTYQLGFRLLELAHEVWSGFDLRLAAQDELLRLHKAVGASVHLAVLDRDSVVVVASQEAGQDLRTSSALGLRLPIHATAAGKVILAYMDSPRQVELLERITTRPFTGKTETSPAELRSELDLTRARGYALEYQEYDEGSVSVAAPILDMEGKPVGAVCISASPAQFDLPRLHGLSAPVIGSEIGRASCRERV